MAPMTKIILLGTIAVVVVMRVLDWAWGREAVLWFLAILISMCVGLVIVDRFWLRQRANELHPDGVPEGPESALEESEVSDGANHIFGNRIWLKRFLMLVEWALCTILVLSGFFLVSIARGDTLSLDMSITGWHLLGTLAGVVGSTAIHRELWILVHKRYSRR